VRCFAKWLGKTEKIDNLDKILSRPLRMLLQTTLGCFWLKNPLINDGHKLDARG
jgi:hypothetical protein